MSVASIPFEASRLKVRRSRDHTSELDKAISDLLARNPVHVNVTPNLRDANYVDWQIVVTEEIPVYFSAILGDAIHNLRSSLDLLACELVRMNRQNDKSVYFPFAESAAALEGEITRRNFHRAAPEVVDHLRSFRPYKGGNAALRGVHDLDVMDKHKMLIPSISEVSIPGAGLGFTSLKPGPQSHGKMLLAAYAPLGLKVGELQPVKLVFKFPLHGPFSEVQIVPGLHRFADYFSRLIDSFETLCFRTQGNANRSP